MNMIRHIVESHLIQSPSYAKLTNREKHDLHTKLLHSAQAANVSYNKIANRNKTVDAPVDYDDAPYEPEEPVPKSPAPKPPAPKSPNRFTANLLPTIPVVVRKGVASHTRSQRRERLFHGDFSPPGSDHQLEIEIFQTKK
jgi:hypothetical protein